MSNCEKYLDLISAYVDGEVTDTEKTEIEAHLEECAECRSILEAYRAISEEVAFDTEEVPEGFADGVMAKVSSYEKKVKNRRNFGIAGRYVGIAACIAIILVAFPRMPHLGCGASMDNAKESAPAAGVADAVVMESFDMITDEEAFIEAEIDFSYAEDVTADCADDTERANGSYAADDVGMWVTLYGEVPEELISSNYTVTYYENGDVEYIVPISIARDIAEKYDSAEVEVLDMEIESMMAKIIITK